MRPQTDATKLLAADVSAARRRLHMTVAVMASQIGISESALRRIETGQSRTVHGSTAFAILAWAATRGYREFAGFTLERAPAPDTPESVAAKAADARAFGERFEALGRTQ